MGIKKRHFMFTLRLRKKVLENVSKIRLFTFYKWGEDKTFF